MINGSPLAPADILGAVTSRPATPDAAGILDQVRDVETSRSKAALIAAAAAQAVEASGEIVALASLCEEIFASDLPEQRKSALLDEIAQIVRKVASSGADTIACRRILVLGLGELLRGAGEDSSTGSLVERLREALMAAARSGTIVGLPRRIPNTA